MNTDIRIDWKSGMEITPQTFIDMENNISEHRMLVRKIIAATNFGVIPRTKFLVSHEVFNGTLMLKQVDCDVLMPSGQVAVVEFNGSLTLNVPPKDVKELYLTLEVGENISNFVKDGIPHVANEYKFDIKTLSEIRNAVPLLKLVQNNGAWAVYEPYIMPVMSARSSVALLEKLETLKQAAQKIIDHDHAEWLEDRVFLMVLLEQLLSFSVDDSSRDFVLLCKRIATALGYSVYKHRPELPSPDIRDIEPYLNAFLAFLADVAVAMNDLKPMAVPTVQEEPSPELEPPVEDEFYPII